MRSAQISLKLAHPYEILVVNPDTQELSDPALYAGLSNGAAKVTSLTGEHVNLTHGAEDAPTNVNAAGQNDVQVSIAADASQPNQFWLWAASDNLRIAAANAVECAEAMAATRPRGKIQ